MSFDISELLTLYDVSTFSLPEKLDDLTQEIIEKATRLFGVCRLAIVLREGERREFPVRWGFRKDEDVLERILGNGENSFRYQMRNGVQGLLYMEMARKISEREKRLCTIFAHRIENIIARKYMEEKIKNSEQEKKLILNSIVEFLVFQDSNHRILWANRAVAEYAGTKPEELTGRFCYEVLHHRNEPCEKCPVIRVLKTGIPQEDTVSSGGRQFFVRGYPVKSKDGLIERIVVVGVDVTENIRAEEAFRTIFNSAHDAIFIHDQDGTIIDVNQTMLQMYGVNSREEAKRLSLIHDYSSPEAPIEQLPERWARVIAGERLTFEWKARRPGDGSVFDAEVSLKKITLTGKDVVLATVRDITERKREADLLKSLFTRSPIGMYIASAGKFQLVNPRFVMLTGYCQEELIGKDTLDLVVPEDRDKVRRNAIKMLKGEAAKPYVFKIVTKKGSIKWIEETVASIWHGGKQVTLGNIIDVTKKKKFEQRLEYISLHDRLTGLYNRTYFEEELQRLSTSREYPITVIMGDINGLKLINDTLGHDKGDKLLTTCAQVIKRALRRSDILARIGGDEFVVLLPRTDEITGKRILERIQLSIDKNNQEHPGLPLSVSFGMATADTPEQPLKEVYKKADDLMYQKKHKLGTTSHSKIINALLTELLERIHVTEEQIRHKQELCQKLGKKAGLSVQQLANLSLLVKVHDLGIIGMPDRIISKKDPLTKSELKLMRQHPERGYHIALSSPDLAGVADLILKHHEKWDGTGYPLGLKGEEIPIECRILSIVDAFDSITTGRPPYCREKAVENALEEIRRYAGTQFDPNLAETFIEMITFDKSTFSEKKAATGHDL